MSNLEPKNIIVRMPNWIGDLVMATPVLVDLKTQFPGCQLTAMCQSPGGSLLEKDKNIDELFSFNKGKWGFERRQANRDIIDKIHYGKYDTGILLTNSFSSAWLFYQGGILRRIGYSRGFRRFLLTERVSFPEGIVHQVDQYKKLLEPLGGQKSETLPQLYVTKQEQDEIRDLLKQRGWDTNEKLIGICPGAAYGLAKCWPLDRYKKLAKEFAEQGHFVLVFGDSSLYLAAKEICKSLPEQVINLAGVTSLRQLMSGLSICSLVVTNDSGPMHIASAMNVSLIAIFGSTDQRKTGPSQGHIIDKHVECSPCFKRTCPIDFRCMKTISVKEVLNLAEKILCSKN